MIGKFGLEIVNWDFHLDVPAELYFTSDFFSFQASSHDTTPSRSDFGSGF
jgi:hypothetical protein